MLTGAAGTITGSASYGPYGTRTTTGSASSSFGFAGQYQDTESGLIWMRARYYGPATGQFVTLDPQVALTRSPYAYADGDPTAQTDPSGDGFLSDLWQAAGSAVKSVAKDTLHGVTGTGQLAQDALTATLKRPGFRGGFDPSPGAIAAKTDIQLVLNSANLLRCEGADLQGAGTAGFAATQCYDPSTGRILNRGSSPSGYQGVYNRVGQYVCDQYGNLYYQDEGYYQGGQYHAISK